MLLSNVLRTTLCLSVAVTAERWSRQLPNSGPETDATNDWVPLAQQTDRSNNARVLNYRPDQYEKNGYILPTDQTQLQRRIPVGQPFQAQGFKAPAKPEPKAFHHGRPPPQRPTSESFFKFEMPFFGNDGSQNEAIPTVQADYQIQHTVPQQTFVTSPLFSQKPVFPPEFHPSYQTQFQPLTQQRPIQQNYVQDIQQQIKEKHVEQRPGLETQQTQGIPPFIGQQSYETAKPTAFQAQLSYGNQAQLSPSVAQEEVQLLYVPYDALYPQRPEQITYDGARFNLIPQPVNPVHINNFYTPEPLTNSDPNLFTTSTIATVSSSTPGPSTTPRSFLNPQFTSSQKPKARPKPHQPPLAMFMQKVSSNPSTVVDVVKALSSSKSIAVIDAPTKTAPPLFVGPAGLPSPNGYAKFELPYLSSINRNNIDFLREVPFFVAPQSYRAPSDFNKISLPQPHVGSIVVNKHLQGVHATQIAQDYQPVPSTTRQPAHPLRDMFVTPMEDSLKYHTSSPTLRTTARPTKLRYQFGTAYSELPGANQNYRQEVKQAPLQPQSQAQEHHNYYQQQYIQEIQSSTTPEPRPSPNYGEIHHNTNEHLQETYKYNPQLQQITSVRPTIAESEQGGNPYYKEIHPATSLRPTTLRPKEHLVQNEYFQDHYDQEFVPVTSIRPTLKAKDVPQLEQYNHEAFPVTSLRPTTIRNRPQYIEHSTQKSQINTSERPSLQIEHQSRQNDFYKGTSERSPLIHSQHEHHNDFHKDTSESPSLIQAQHQHENDFYKEQYNYHTTPSTSPKPTRTKQRQGQIKFNRAQYNEELQSEISDAKDYRDQMQYLSANYKQENHQSTTRAPTTRTKTVDRGRNSYNKRPIEISTQSTYGHFKPMPNNVVNEEYFKVQPLKTSSSTSTTTSTTTTTTEPPLQQHSSEAISQPQYAQLSEAAPTVEIKPISDFYQHKVNPQPSYYDNKDEEEYQMKTYFRQQDAFKNRQSTTTPVPLYENVQYTPISLDYASHLYNVPSTTKSYYEESTRTKPKERITFFAPTPHNENEQSDVVETPTLPIQHPTVENHREAEHHEAQTEAVTEITTKYSTTPSIIHHSSTERRRPVHKHHIPTNHRANYNNEVVFTHDIETPKEQEKEQELEYEPNPYELPSELPPLTPNLPGLVNALIEKDKENAIEKGTTEMEPPTTTSSTTFRPTRRPINRGRRPTVSRTHSSGGYSSNYETTTLRPITRARRPYNTRNSYNSQTNQTYVSTTARPIVRNPNRVRYNPSPEERRQYRPRTRVHSKKITKEEDNLDYQRDVLKQNYPIFKPTRSTPTTATTSTTTSTTELPTDAPEVIITITPSSDGGSNKEHFSGFLEPLQIAHEYQQRHDNYGPGYFPNEEEIVPTEALVEKNEIHELHPVYTTPPTTPELPRETTRKPLFKRRGPKPTRTTTEATPTTTFVNEERYTEKSTGKYTEKPTERFTIRPRVRPERPERPKVVKIRGRIRKPTPPTHPASTTTIASEKKTPQNGYQQLNRFNQDFYEEDYRDEIAPNNQRQEANYNLETQESQWSPSLSNLNGFRPVHLEERSKFGEKPQQFEDEPDIVTAGPGPSSAGRRNTFSVKVSAGFGPSSYGSSKKQELKDEKSSSTETSFSDLLEEVMSGVESTYKNQQEEPEEDDSRKPKQGRRKGAWKRVRVTPVDALEAAESQNIGTQFYNAIFASNEQDKVDKSSEDRTTLSNFDSTADSLEVTTLNPIKTNFGIEPHYTEIPNPSEETTVYSDPKINRTDKSTYKETDSAATTLEQSIDKGPDEYTDATEYDTLDTVTDTITRRSDEEVTEDLESQPSLFDEVKKQLSNLFTVEEEKDESDPIKSNFQPRKQEYTSIQRIRAVSENSDNKIKDTENKPDEVTVSPFHKNLMETVVYATSTSTEISHETEICYRGRCVKTAKKL